MLLTLLLLCGGEAGAQELPSGAPKRLTIATRVVPPFVVEEDGHLSGFSIELWRHIERKIGVQSHFTTHPSVKALLADVKGGGADAGVAAISITSEREREMDFSQPIFDSGMQIMVRDQRRGNAGFDPLSILFSPALLKLLGVTLVLILLPAHLIWLVERKHEDGLFSGTEKYKEGIGRALWWSASCLAAQADEMPKSAAGRVLAVCWMFGSVLFIAYFTAAVTTSLTVQQLTGTIAGPRDLPGKKVATTAGSTSAAYLRQEFVRPQEYPSIDEAIEALVKGRAEAVVYDSPVLLYYAAREGKGKVRVVGNIFRQEDYGIVFPRNSPYRKPVNAALLSLQEDGTYQELYDKWFTTQ